MKKHIIFMWMLFPLFWMAGPVYGAIMVGRIAHAEGRIYRYVDVAQGWVETFAETPAGSRDVLATGAESRAEIAFPNNVLLRMGGKAEVEIRNLEEDASQFVLQNGLARFYNGSAGGGLTVETPMGTVWAGPGSIVDLRVDGNSLAVSTVHGSAVFQSLINGIEKREIISASSSLEFYEESIIAGVGPLDRNWDRWCADRDKIWARNRLVRSEYLPENMQEYAYVMEPYGSWRRVYYRGYYYWAWQPREVAAGWAPYTTGVWYDWQGAPVWIDQNPWGWVTHHHGNWILMQETWMWTPYVHITDVPGVTVVGFDIVFGGTYRPHWHPGRVRWISNDNYVGWFPLAPWETYYGSRSWGPGSELVQAGAKFNININLAGHSHVDHAVIITGRDLHRMGPLTGNNYNSVRIKKIDKTALVKNYKPVPRAGMQQNENSRMKASQAISRVKRPVMQPERRTAGKEEAAVAKNSRRTGGMVYRDQNEEQQEKKAYKGMPRAAGTGAGTYEQTRNFVNMVETPKRLVTPEQRTGAGKREKQERTVAEKTISARPNPQRSYALATMGAAEVRPTIIGGGNSRSGTGPENRIVAAGQRDSATGKQGLQKSGITQRQVQQQSRDPRAAIYKERSGNYAAEQRRQEIIQEKGMVSEQRHGPPQNVSREGQVNTGQVGRNRVSASDSNRHLR